MYSYIKKKSETCKSVKMDETFKFDGYIKKEKKLSIVVHTLWRPRQEDNEFRVNLDCVEFSISRSYMEIFYFPNPLPPSN